MDGVDVFYLVLCVVLRGVEELGTAVRGNPPQIARVGLLSGGYKENLGGIKEVTPHFVLGDKSEVNKIENGPSTSSTPDLHPITSLHPHPRHTASSFRSLHLFASRKNSSTNLTCDKMASELSDIGLYGLAVSSGLDPSTLKSPAVLRSILR